MIPKKNPELEVGRNSSLYFAIGLNVMLFFSWQAIEYKTYEKDDIKLDVVMMDSELDEEIPLVTMNTPPPPPPPPVVMQESVQIIEDTEDVEETVFESTEASQDDLIAEVISVEDVDVGEIEEDVEVPFAVIEDVPLFPGCENVKKSERRNCFQQKMNAHVVKNFNYPQTALDMGIKGRVFVIFVISPEGEITKVRTRGPDKILEDEAQRIISKLPKMIPGKQRGKPVSVPFSLPINFKMAEQ
ncbi:energy transducer TonB [Jejuia pallidilutea]|uniref:Ferric siderophore transport system periplasmic binding protein TonB n=1 Tax=Jejuia pallidilutea TaxID=504487 RepID=A0A090W6K9_9FLAO|nr:energy transducer TonB [Jejuia pallidilutea]GAL68610.1 ferric siderophore transport system periplasmic binding protein TonB [Jejuia pallidilutea]GAL72551.1 ferric siderophore transport system periplasmic binding protein TonB [Jejuia pallidilutea]GAL90196.1 ferric siderophore transport system periplasmic binding protein TonB [Jejuia pallidilutea]